MYVRTAIERYIFLALHLHMHGHGVGGRQSPGRQDTRTPGSKQDPQTLPPAAEAANTGLSW